MPERKEENSREKLKKLLTSPYTMAAATVLPAALTYLVNRRVRKLAPEHQALGKSIREQGLGAVSFHEPELGKAQATLRYGTPNVRNDPKNLKPNLGAVIAPNGAEGITHPNAVANGVPVPELRGTKQEENNYIRYMMGNVVPPTLPLHDEIGHAGYRPDELMQHLQDRLKTKHPNGYVLKQNFGSGAKPYTEQHNLLAEYNRLASIDPQHPHPVNVPGWKKPTLSVSELMALAKDDPYSFTELAKHLPEDLRGPALLHGALQNPELLVSQDRLPLKGELRIHSVGPRVIRSATVARHDRLAGMRTLLGMKTGTEKQVEEHVENLLRQRLPGSHIHDVPFAMDVGWTHDHEGKLQVHMLDMNAGGWSGMLKGRAPGSIVPAAVNMNKYVSELAGQDTRPLAATKALGAGLAGGAALTGARELVGEPDEPTL